MPIYLIRHGETDLNASRVFQPANTSLSKLGFAQAKALGERLLNTHIDAVVTSDLLRAIQTTQGIVEIRPPLRLHTSELLQERNLGDYRGKSYESVGIDLLSLKEAPPGGESMSEFEDRVAAAFEYIIELHQDIRSELEEGEDNEALDGVPSPYPRNPEDPEGRDPVLVVVTHGLVIRGILEKFARLAEGMQAPQHLANTSVTIFGAAPPHLLELLNCAEHLSQAQSGSLNPTTKASAFGG